MTDWLPRPQLMVWRFVWDDSGWWNDHSKVADVIADVEVGVLDLSFFLHGIFHCLSSLTFAQVFKYSTVCTWTQGLYYNEMGKS